MSSKKSGPIFIVVSIIVSIVLGVGIYYLLYSRVWLIAVNNFSNSIYEYSNNLAANYFNLERPEKLEKIGNVSEYIASIKENSSIRNIILTEANGTIIYADNKSLKGTSLLDDNNWKSAIAGSIVTNKENNEIISAYLPLKNDDLITRGVLKLELSLPPEIVNLDREIIRVSVAIFGGYFVLVLFSYSLVSKFERKMQEKERSITEKALAFAEDQKMYQAIATSLAEALIVVNRDGQIILFNPEAEKIFGYKSNQVELKPYKKVLQFYDENGKKVSKDLIAKAIENRKIMKTSPQEEIFVKNNALLPVDISVAPIINDEEAVKGAAIIVSDITPEKELQKVKDEFVFVVAHELGNPIFALNGYLTIIKDRLSTKDKDTSRMMKEALKINNELSSLVNELLEVARNEMGKLTFEIENVNLTKIIKEVIEDQSFKAKKKNISLKYTPQKTASVKANEKKIKEVLTNLINNAIKYTPNGGKVEIETKTKGHLIEVSVSDNGIGMTPEEQKHLFEKFFRAKNKETEKISGTGLGLFISKEIIEKCGGKMWAESEKGKGSTFYFTLRTAK